MCITPTSRNGPSTAEVYFLGRRMSEPPSLVLLTLLALVYLSQTVRLGNVAVKTKGRVGASALNHWTYLFFVPIIVATLNPDAIPSLVNVILLVRAHFLAIIVTMLTVAEMFMRLAVMNGIARLAGIVEDSHDPDELKAATDALCVLGLYDLALFGLKRLATSDSDPSSVYSHIASLYGIQRQFQRAEEAALRAVAINPENAFGHYYLGLALNELGRADEAASCIQTARDLGVPISYSRFPRESPNQIGPS